MIAATEGPPGAVVAHFAPETAHLQWHRVAAGFSGAVVWRGDDKAGAPQLAVKGWPPDTPPERVAQVHRWQARAAHLSFVPALVRGKRGFTSIPSDGRLWEACRWMPGAPRPAPTLPEVQAACAAVAQLHLAWPAEALKRPCRGVVGRLELLLADPPRFASGGPLPRVAPELDPLLNEAARVVARLAEPVAAALRPWAAWPLSERPCVRDLRAEHVLFRDGRVTGIVDFGATALDNPACDLARLLSDFDTAALDLFDEGLRAYRESGGPLDAPDELVRLLAAAGVVGSALGWLVRVFVRHEPLTRPAAVAERLAGLLKKIERIRPFAPISEAHVAPSEFPARSAEMTVAEI